MSSVEELLSVAESDTGIRGTNDSRIEIDADTRIIQMMPQDELFGVESDEKSERKYFKVHKIVGNGVDLSKLQLRINYQNASKIPSGKDMYIVKDATVYNDEWLYFSWELSRKVTLYKGTIYFVVCAVKTDSNGNITNEWNITLAEGKVLEGLEVETSQEQQYQASDYLEQLKQQLLDYSKEIKDTFPSDYTQMQDDIGSLKGDLSQLSSENTELKSDLAELQSGGYVADQQQIGQKVSDWLDEHPEATTTVQDGSLTYAKIGTELRNQTVHIVCDKTGDITDLIRDIVKSNRHIRFYGCDAITNSVSFSDLQNVTLEFVNSKIMFCYDHDASNNQIAFEFSDCENICVKGLNITTDYSDTNDINLDIQGLYNNKLYGIWLHNVDKSSIVNCNISQFTDGLSVNYCNNVDVYKCRLYNIGQEPAVFRNCSQCSMTFCEVYWHGGDGTLVKHWDSDAISGFVFADNYFHDGKIVTSSGGNIICGGGFTSNVEGNDTILRDPEYIIVRNNKFIDTEYGVLLAGGSHIIVDGNLIKSKVKEDGNYYTYAALGLDYSVYNLPDIQNYADIKFINNTVERASRGIYIAIKSTESVTITHEDILISGNIIKNCKNEAIETHNSLIVGNRFENVQLSMIYDSLFVGNIVTGTDNPINEYCRFQATNCDVLSNKFDMGALYFDNRNTVDVSITGNTFNSCELFRIETTSGYVYLENTFSANQHIVLLTVRV